MLEKKVEQTLKEGVEAAGGLCIKFVPLYFAGFPDRIVLIPGGRLFFVELKAPGQKPKRRQPYVIKLLRRLGFDVRVIDSVNSVNDFLVCL